MEVEEANQSHEEPSAAWLRALVQNALDCIITIDEAGRIIEFNPAAEATFGYRRIDVIARSMAEIIIPKRFRDAHHKGVSRFLAGGESHMIGKRVEVIAQRADGNEFPAELTVVAVHPEAAPVFTAYIRDISETVEAKNVRHRAAEQIKQILLETALTVARVVEIRDPYTAGHQRRVAHLAASIAKYLDLSSEQIEGIFFAALLHDIGKIAVPAEILSRPGTLHSEDTAYLKTHCQKGYEIVKDIDFPWPVAKVVLQHHERLDGTGYPNGLFSRQICMEARIVAVADTVEAYTSHRPYRPAQPLSAALSLILEKAGEWYDSTVVEICLELFQAGYRLGETERNGKEWLTMAPYR
jgi:PAS domain S-box-containing protein/putative nucleotidyltransferase with HDIG domain